ncbi:MAG: HYR domain-containing protein, partial [Verrucomicrobiota bacterium]
FKSTLISRCIQDITLKDTIKPIITCPKDIIVNSDENCLAIVEWDDPISSDNCSPIRFVSSHESGAEFAIGTRTIYYSVFDACGNQSGCNFQVTVLDNCCNEAPIIECPVDFSSCPQDIDPSVTGHASIRPGRNCGTPILYYIDDTIFHSLCSLNVNRIWIGIDSAHHELRDSCIQRINLKDEESPTLTCPHDITVMSDAECKAIVSWNTPVATDHCSQVKIVSTHKSGSKFEVGTTTVVVTASDECGNAMTCSFKITVEANCCNKPPVVICPANFVGCPQGIEPAITGKASALKANKFCTPPTLIFHDDTLFSKLCSLNVNTYEPRQGRNAATVVCSASAVVTLACSILIYDFGFAIEHRS